MRVSPAYPWFHSLGSRLAGSSPDQKQRIPLLTQREVSSGITTWLRRIPVGVYHVTTTRGMSTGRAGIVRETTFV